MTSEAAYGITFNTTTKHYIRTDTRAKTLCGRNVFFLLSPSNDEHGLLNDRPTCERCEASKKLHLTADRIDWNDPNRPMIPVTT